MAIAPAELVHPAHSAVTNCSRPAAQDTAVTSVVLVGTGGHTIVRSVNMLARFWRGNEQFVQECARKTVTANTAYPPQAHLSQGCHEPNQIKDLFHLV